MTGKKKVNREEIRNVLDKNLIDEIVFSSKVEGYQFIAPLKYNGVIEFIHLSFPDEILYSKKLEERIFGASENAKIFYQYFKSDSGSMPVYALFSDYIVHF